MSGPHAARSRRWTATPDARRSAAEASPRSCRDRRMNTGVSAKPPPRVINLGNPAAPGPTAYSMQQEGRSRDDDVAAELDARDVANCGPTGTRAHAVHRRRTRGSRSADQPISSRPKAACYGGDWSATRHARTLHSRQPAPFKTAGVAPGGSRCLPLDHRRLPGHVPALPMMHRRIVRC